MLVLSYPISLVLLYWMIFHPLKCMRHLVTLSVIVRSILCKRVSFRPFNFNCSDILLLQYDGLIYKLELLRKVHSKIYLVPYWSLLVSLSDAKGSIF